MARDSYHHIARPPAPGAPLVFAFHGTGGDEHQFTGLVDQILPGAGLVAPRGDVSERGAARFFRRTGEGVYDMDDLARGTEKMAGFVRTHKAAHPDAPVFGLGYSNGANILASVMFDAPDLFDRAALLHPLIPWTPAPPPGLAGKHVLITAGRHDPICPWPMTEALIGLFEREGAEVTTAIHPGGHEIRQEELTALAAAFVTDPVSA
ncbi:MAG: alpha/beta hydrolase [Rhodobacteraceae bacterium]|nr:alpha/beta hydrolase [Paracoccaceae bacterium]